jgi:WD40 repeat protein
LRTLRNSICISCKQKFAPASLVSSQAATVDSSRLMNRTSPSRRPSELTDPTFSLHRLPKGHHASDKTPRGSEPTPPVAAITDGNNLKPASIYNSPTTAPSSSSKSITPIAEPSVPCWSIKRDATADVALDVTFVRVFIHHDPVQSVRFSVDGKYLAAAVKDNNWHNNGMVYIYEVETGKKTWSVSK